MRLWHVDLLTKLPRQQLLGQHRECAALRGKGWGKKHATVNYVFTHSYACLFWYHLHVIDEMKKRGYQVERNWYDCHWRGKRIGWEYTPFIDARKLPYRYPEHNAAYYVECVDNLASKGVVINIKIEGEMK